jgi:hypothetical protein
MSWSACSTILRCTFVTDGHADASSPAHAAPHATVAAATRPATKKVF